VAFGWLAPPHSSALSTDTLRPQDCTTGVNDVQVKPTPCEPPPHPIRETLRDRGFAGSPQAPKVVPRIGKKAVNDLTNSWFPLFVDIMALDLSSCRLLGLRPPEFAAPPRRHVAENLCNWQSPASIASRPGNSHAGGLIMVGSEQLRLTNPHVGWRTGCLDRRIRISSVWVTAFRWLSPSCGSALSCRYHKVKQQESTTYG
jgi:hypothetical protein